MQHKVTIEHLDNLRNLRNYWLSVERSRVSPRLWEYGDSKGRMCVAGHAADRFGQEGVSHHWHTEKRVKYFLYFFKRYEARTYMVLSVPWLSLTYGSAAVDTGIFRAMDEGDKRTEWLAGFQRINLAIKATIDLLNTQRHQELQNDSEKEALQVIRAAQERASATRRMAGNS